MIWQQGNRFWLVWMLTVGGALIEILLATLLPSRVLAQITPDETLGREGSRVTHNVEVRGGKAERIDGGARRGANLFHSFREFNVNDGQRVYFADPSGVENILGRVTGNDASDIMGTLGVDGGANLFLINPNGIIFGRNARLDVSGSFIATTASRFTFSDGNEFSTINPQTPPLLTMSAPIGVQFGTNRPGMILLSGSNLSINPGESLLLIGGDITIDNSKLLTNEGIGGQIELAGLNSSGTIKLARENNLFSLSTVPQVGRSNIQIQNNSLVDVTGVVGGDLKVYADNLYITNSSLQAGVAPGLGIDNAQSGNIVLDVTNDLRLADDGRVVNQVADVPSGQPISVGNAGNIIVRAGSLVATNASRFDGTIFGRGSGGDIDIAVRGQMSFYGVGLHEGYRSSSGISSVVTSSAIGEGGNIKISAGSLQFADGADISTATLGVGNAGDIEINARDAVRFDGGIPGANRSSGINSRNFDPSQSDAGNIRITANSLELTNGANVSSAAFGEGRGNAGDISLDIRDHIRFNGFRSLDAGKASFYLGSGITAEVFGEGRGGDIRITTNNLFLNQSGTISAATSGSGRAGDITITAESVKIANSGIIATSTEGDGQGGAIRIDADQIDALNGGQVVSTTTGSGTAGNIQLNADTIKLSGVDSNYEERLRPFRENSTIRNQGTSSGYFSGVYANENVKDEDIRDGKIPGSAGAINVDAEGLQIDNGARITAATTASTGGNINLQISDSLRLNNSGQISASTQTGQGGSIRLNANRTFANAVAVRGGSTISAEATQTGNAGDLLLNTRRLTVQGENSSVSARSESGTGGDVAVDAAQVAVRNGGVISAATDIGRAGDVRVNATNSVQLSGQGSQISVEATARQGRAGNLNIATDELAIKDEATASVSNVKGQAGNLDVSANSILLDNGNLTAVAGVGSGANITLRNLDSLVMRHGSQISADAKSAASGGNVNINPDGNRHGFIVAVPEEDSDIVARAETGRGGEINITSDAVLGIEEHSPSADNGSSDIDASSERGPQGVVTINRPDVDPSRGLTDLPTDVVDASNQISQVCPTGAVAARKRSEFITTGRGGLPPNPESLLNGERLLADWVTLNKQESANEETAASTLESETAVSAEAPLVEAQGWVRGPHGEVIFVAQSSASSQTTGFTPTRCR